MTERSADDLQRENDELRQENGELRDGLRAAVGRQAAAEVGLDPRFSQWLEGEDYDEALANAHVLARAAGSPDPHSTPSLPPEAQAIQQHLAETHQATAAVVDTDRTPQEG
ncbi:MAG TPA: hypothetical protein VHR18_13420 [Solirubrobacterales bacterium]|jgi:hypothetical protein|nr:hypothetical protein [Solirubrobacterales bacterium]